MGAKAGKSKLRARAGKYKLGARAGKKKIKDQIRESRPEARARAEGQVKSWGPGNTKTP